MKAIEIYRRQVNKSTKHMGIDSLLWGALIGISLFITPNIHKTIIINGALGWIFFAIITLCIWFILYIAGLVIKGEMIWRKIKQRHKH